MLNALTTLLDQVEEFPEQLDKQAKLYNLLSNIYISEWCLARIRDVIIPRLFDLKENHGLLDHGESCNKYERSNYMLIVCLQFSC